MKLIFLGPPGAGKGTMAVRLANDLNVPHISTGDIFRKAIKDETELGVKVKAILAAGDLVPDELTIGLVEERLQKDDCQKGFILDGFPRTIPQAEGLSKFSSIEAVINFTIEDEKIIRRLSGRRVCPSTGKTYHIEYDPPKVEGKDDETGESLIIREDDQPEAIANRLDVYKDQTQPLINFYTDAKLIRDVNADQSQDQVYSELKSVLNI